MTPQESQPLPVPEAEAAFPIGASSIATALFIAGLTLVVYWWRLRVLRRERVAAAMEAAGPDEVGSLTADMKELTERLATELDARAERLERLLDAADQRIAELDKAIARGMEVKPLARPHGQVDPAFAEVYELADQGLRPVEIARRTQRPTGQVELILNLRRGTVAL
ncbi:hypothetical protein PHYC_03054 [Phycisphaerales bacterium]|nr:hypothetical protein PHYC_03054 [Phycisphaerales bacterium]